MVLSYELQLKHGEQRISLIRFNIFSAEIFKISYSSRANLTYFACKLETSRIEMWQVELYQCLRFLKFISKMKIKLF